MGLKKRHVFNKERHQPKDINVNVVNVKDNEILDKAEKSSDDKDVHNHHHLMFNALNWFGPLRNLSW